MGAVESDAVAFVGVGSGELPDDVNIVVFCTRSSHSFCGVLSGMVRS